MEWHFGCNCKYYLPTMNKCRILIDKYGRRADLLDQMWLSTQKMMLYLNLPHEQLVREITAGNIKVRAQKNGQLVYLVAGAWQYDECPLGDTGGQCWHFHAHPDKKISCIQEGKHLARKFPYCQSAPTEHDVERFESEVSKLIRQRQIHPSDHPVD